MMSNGIVFRVNNILCITPAEEILEVVQGPSPQPIPLTKPWLMGILQFRGEIIPITDLERFISEESDAGTEFSSQPSIKDPILVFVKDSWTYGIKISHLIGIQPMPKKVRPVTEMPSQLALLQPIINGYTKIDNAEPMYVVNLSSLTDLESFMNSYQSIKR